LSIKYESARASQRQLAALIDHPVVFDSVIGIDLVGDETMFDGEFYSPILKNWRAAGKFVRAHVGECGTANNVADAISSRVTNIAHGLAIVNDEELLCLAADSNISFDLGLTSNLLTGVTTTANHPLRAMLDAGLHITLGTDDPIVCNTALDCEFLLARVLGATEVELNQIRHNALRLCPTRDQSPAGCI
jgi:adenosine deaminase